MRACRARSLPELLGLIAASADGFDAVNVSHAMCRLAKLHRSALEQSQSAAGSTALRELVLPAVSSLCEQLPRLINDFDCWSVASCLWALSVLNCYDQAVFNLLCHRGSLIAYAQMKPADCAMILLAFGRFGHYHPELLRYVPQVCGGPPVWLGAAGGGGQVPSGSRLLTRAPLLMHRSC